MSPMTLERRANAKVTIGVCVKNGEKTLSQAIDSIKDQDYPHELMEIIFVDDGSEDNTPAIIRKSIISVDIESRVFHQEWKGLGASRDLVVDNARGKYIVWVDSDMILPTDHVSKQVEFVEKNPRIGIAKATYGLLKENSLVSFLENVSYVTIDKMYGGKSTERTLGTGGSIYRVDAIRLAGGFDPAMKGVGEDMDAEFRVKKAGWLLQLGTPAVFYEQHRTSLLALWKEGLWYGYGGNATYRKNTSAFSLLRMSPVAGLLAGALYSTFAYRLFRRKAVFLLAFERAFKLSAWCLGFMRAQIELKTKFSLSS